MSKISIISANYNKAAFIAETINCILAQTYSNWELIIIDDASTDNSIAEIEKFTKKEDRISVVALQTNKGGNYARNKGIEKATGEYLLFLDSDDLLTETCLENRLKTASDNPENDAWIFPMGVFQNKIGDGKSSDYWKPFEQNYLKAFLRHNLPWSICQPLWKTSFVKQINGFDLDFIRLQDVEFHTRALLNEARIKISPFTEADCYYRIAEERFNNDMFPYLERYVKGASQYYNKFSIVLKEQKKELIGTLFGPCNAIVYQKRLKKISTSEYKSLTKDLLNLIDSKYQKMVIRFYFFIERISPVHPKGLKFIVNKLLYL